MWKIDVHLFFLLSTLFVDSFASKTLRDLSNLKKINIHIWINYIMYLIKRHEWFRLLSV
jgi:hypothetical protein